MISFFEQRWFLWWIAAIVIVLPWHHLALSGPSVIRQPTELAAAWRTQNCSATSFRPAGEASPTGRVWFHLLTCINNLRSPSFIIGVAPLQTVAPWSGRGPDAISHRYYDRYTSSI